MIEKIGCVLLIDDDEEDNYFHKLVLEESGYFDRIEIIENSTDAIEILRQNTIRPDLIFLDVNMPKINGWELVEECTKFSNGNDPRIIMHTTSLNPSDKTKASKFPIAGFETKPLTREKLESILLKFNPS